MCNAGKHFIKILVLKDAVLAGEWWYCMNKKRDRVMSTDLSHVKETTFWVSLSLCSVT